MDVKRKIGALLVSLGLVSGAAGAFGVHSDAIKEREVIFTQDMGRQIAYERLAIHKNHGDSDAGMMYHYSHRSHSSHYSHRSHSSHYSSYY